MAQMDIWQRVKNRIDSYVEAKAHELKRKSEEPMDVLAKYVRFSMSEKPKVRKVSCEDCQVENVVEENEDGLLVNLDLIYGGFDPKVLVNMTDLVSVDISGCCHVDTYLFIESVIRCVKIEKFEMVGCKQFSEQQIIDICTSLPKLTYFDASGCTGILSVSTNTILCNLQNLKVLKVVAKYPEYDRKDWCKVVSHFLNVTFGDDILRIVNAK